MKPNVASVPVENNPSLRRLLNSPAVIINTDTEAFEAYQKRKERALALANAEKMLQEKDEKISELENKLDKLQKQMNTVLTLLGTSTDC